MIGQSTNKILDIDRSEILAEIYARNRLRIEAQLPRLNIRKEYEHAVLVQAWRIHVGRHHDRVREEVLGRQREKYGSEWPSSWGGRVGLNLLMQQVLHASFKNPA